MGSVRGRKRGVSAVNLSLPVYTADANSGLCIGRRCVDALGGRGVVDHQQAAPDIYRLIASYYYQRLSNGIGCRSAWSFAAFAYIRIGKFVANHVTGSKTTGGFCVTRKGLLQPSKLGHILMETPALLNYDSEPGEFVKYKGRFYCWIDISAEGVVVLSKSVMNFLKTAPGIELLSIRSSDIAFTMGAKGPLLQKAENYAGEMPAF